MAFVRSRQKKLADVSRSTIGMFEALETRRLLAGDGLKGEYFDNADLTGPALTRVDSTVDFDWAADGPAQGIDHDTFSVRWSGQVEPEFSETYTFMTASDDGVRLWVNGQLLVDQWNEHAVGFHGGSIDLVGGQKYDIKMEYFEAYGQAVAALHWTSPSQAYQVVPAGRLYSAAAPAPADVGSIEGLVLINADTNQPIRQLGDNEIIDLGNLPTRNISIAAQVGDDGPVESVRFELDGSAYRTENNNPFVVSGDTLGDIHPWKVSAGQHTLSATPFVSDYASGAAGAAAKITFTIGSSPAIPTSLVAASNTSSAVTLRWSDNASNESGCIVERSSDGEIFLPLADVGPNVSTFTDDTVAESTEYWYRVAAVNGIGVSAYTAPLVVTTPASVPTTPPTTDPVTPPITPPTTDPITPPATDPITPPTTDPTPTGSSDEIPAVTGKIITVNPGESIDAALDSANPGDHVVVKPGVYKESITVSRSGEAGKPIVLRPETPGTVTIDASGKSSALIASGGKYIFISGLTISGAANDLTGNHNAAVRTSDGWVIQDCIIEKNAGGGISVNGRDTIARRIIAQDNGRFGIGGSGGRNILVQDCISRRNNRVTGDSDGGGGKFTRLDGAVIERYQSYDNGGVGLWLDINNINVVVRDSEFHNNITIWKSDGTRKIWGDGMNIEISGVIYDTSGGTTEQGQGPITVENCRVWDNEHDGILAYASRNVTLKNNTITNDDIYIKDGKRLPWYLTKLTVTDNTLVNSYIELDNAVAANYQTRELTLDRNTFVNCSKVYRWNFKDVNSIDTIRTEYGFELNSVVK